MSQYGSICVVSTFGKNSLPQIVDSPSIRTSNLCINLLQYGWISRICETAGRPTKSHVHEWLDCQARWFFTPRGPWYFDPCGENQPWSRRQQGRVRVWALSPTEFERTKFYWKGFWKSN